MGPRTVASREPFAAAISLAEWSRDIWRGGESSLDGAAASKDGCDDEGDPSTFVAGFVFPFEPDISDALDLSDGAPMLIVVPDPETLLEFDVGARVDIDTCLAAGVDELLFVLSNVRFDVGLPNGMGDLARRNCLVLLRRLRPGVLPRRLPSEGEGEPGPSGELAVGSSLLELDPAVLKLGRD